MKKFVFIVVSATIIASCNVGELEFDNLEVTPITGVFSFPLGESTYVMSDLLGNQTGDSLNFQQDSTSLYILLYYDTLNYGAPDDLVQIGDITYSGSTNTTIAAGPDPFNLIATFQGEYNPQKNEQLDSMYYATGDLSITSTTDIPYDISYTFTITNTVHVTTGVPITVSGNIPAGAGTRMDTQSSSLVNHKTVLTDPSGDNIYDVDLNATVTLGAGDALDGTESFSFDLTYQNQTFNLIYGKFGRDTVQVGNQSIDIDFFSQAAREGITFGNPSITFDFRNSFGVPLGIDFSGVYGENDEGQTFMAGNIVSNDPVIAGSGIDTPTPTTPGETAETIVEINRSNSNLVNLLSRSPDRLVFDVTGISNPGSITAANYLQPSSSISAYVTLEVPFEVQLEDYQETGSFDLGDGLELDNVDSAFIRIVTDNYLPFNGTINLEVQDADSVNLFPITDTSDPAYDQSQVDRLTNIPAIKAPLINTNGVVTDPSGLTTDIYLTEDEVDLLANASHVIITMTLNTPVSQTSRDIYVKILADYSLNLKVGIGGKFNLDL